MSEKTTLNVAGMSCQHCVMHVTKALEEVPGLLSVKVDLEKEQAQVEYDPAKTNPGVMEQAVSGAGYSASH